jgi:hypothetical protein
MEKKTYMSPISEVIEIDIESALLADSPLIFEGGQGNNGQGVPADDVIDL